MKISYNWLKTYLKINLTAEEAGKILTDCGLEVESIELVAAVKGGLNGIVVGEVKTKEKHPDADRLSVTTVDTGTGTLLNIVCGAANVAAGQKVLVATIGSTLYPTSGEPFEIKKSKIRGQLSEGMICAEDEIGLGTSHDGIMVLDSSAVTGMSAKAYFKLEDDHVFEIGLTPNRADAASHIGVARDLLAYLNYQTLLNNTEPLTLELPNVNGFTNDNTDKKIDVIIEDTIGCPRYSGITISGIKVSESPDWLKNRLTTIGLKPINNIVDITNFVLHELGQPLHAFDADKITGEKVIVKKIPVKTKFKTLDGIERELNNEDLMICNVTDPMCIAGVYGGIDSGITEKTTTIFLESAYFDPVHIRKTSKRHGLKTDASFRFERGTDPNMTVYALKRAAALIREIAGGRITSEIIDIYPTKIEPFKVGLSYKNCNDFIGKEIGKKIIKNILVSLGIEIITEGADALMLAVPPFKVDVKREVDVIEEVLRIYGYNNVEIPSAIHASLSYSDKPDPEQVQHTIAELLSNNGFSEIMTNSLTRSDYYTNLSSVNSTELISVLNPLSSDLNILRRVLLFSGLEAVSYNINRKNSDLKLYEFGKTYLKTIEGKYIENKHLALFVTGRKETESWNNKYDSTNFYSMKGYVNTVLSRLGVTGLKYETNANDDLLTENLNGYSGKKQIVRFGKIKPILLKQFDIKQDVYYTDFNWDNILELIKKQKFEYHEIPKFPSVRRDLALLLDKAVSFEQLEQIAYQTERKFLKEVRIFDVYEGNKLEAGKKSYAISFTLLDENETLTDKQIEKIMEKLIKAYTEKAGAAIR
ncbi:MAG: phenylalanine--tRNA ligase subunit beta [Bacteroidetes bacterium]|nr:phenylalanine--tRNA ligase subunit beta [Bacteroidota bacterium]